MAVTILTKSLQKALQKAVRGCTFGTLPITSMIGIKVEDNKLSLIATDQLNYIQVNVDLEGKNSKIDVSIPADKFYKLIQKMTTENIILTLKDTYLEVKGDGKSKAVYKFDIPLDGEDLMKSSLMPEIAKADITEKGQIEQKEFKAILANTKFSVPKDNSLNSNGYHYGGYYCGENVITFNGQTSAIYETKLFKTPYLFCKEALTLIDTMDSEIIMYQRNNDAMLLVSDSVLVYTLELDKKSAYPVDVVNGFFENIKEDSMCKISKQELNQVIDRISLFVVESGKGADNKPIKLSFGKKAVSISNKKASSSEEVEYLSINNFKPYECSVNFENVKAISAVQSNEITIYFGDENSLKFVGDKTKHLTSLIQDGIVNTEDDFKSEDINVDEETSVPEDYNDDQEIPF